MNKADIHCHILPGVDDGSASYNESLELLRMEEAAGVKNVILTPHLRYHMFDSADEDIIRRFKILNEKREKAGIEVRIALSREYHYDRSLAEALKNKSVILMNGRTMLLEFSHDTRPESMKRAVSQLLDLNIRPLIAHIERYEAVQTDITLAEELTALGALIQVNAGSLLGDEGAKQKKTVKALMKKDLVFAVASDSHDPEFRKPDLDQCEKYMLRKYGEEYTRKVLHDHPMQLMP